MCFTLKKIKFNLLRLNIWIETQPNTKVIVAIYTFVRYSKGRVGES